LGACALAYQSLRRHATDLRLRTRYQGNRDQRRPLRLLNILKQGQYKALREFHALGTVGFVLKLQYSKPLRVNSLLLSCHDHDLVMCRNTRHCRYTFLKSDNRTAKRSHLSIAVGHLRAANHCNPFCLAIAELTRKVANTRAYTILARALELDCKNHTLQFRKKTFNVKPPSPVLVFSFCYLLYN